VFDSAIHLLVAVGEALRVIKAGRSLLDVG
jgi:hypothetical protein